MTQHIAPRDMEVYFDKQDIIVSKTDLKGRITYANKVFLDIAGYREAEVMGQPHSIIRHPDMPRCVFKLLWDTLADEREVFAYVKNLTKSGAYYWVFAHVTPSRRADGTVVGYHSNRRVPDPDIVRNKIIPLYNQLLAIERAATNRKEGMHKAFAALTDILKKEGKSYDEFIFSL